MTLPWSDFGADNQWRSTMGMQHRASQRRAMHDTDSMRRHAVQSELWWEHKPNDRVRTIDGVPGVVTAVYDGFAPGNEEYEVTLDRGLGGGRYTASQLANLTSTTATEHHLASDDYPELGTLLHDRPDPARHTAAATDYQRGNGSRSYVDEARPYEHHSDSELDDEQSAIDRHVEYYSQLGGMLPDRVRTWRDNVADEVERRRGGG